MCMCSVHNKHAHAHAHTDTGRMEREAKQSYTHAHTYTYTSAHKPSSHIPLKCIQYYYYFSILLLFFSSPVCFGALFWMAFVLPIRLFAHSFARSFYSCCVLLLDQISNLAIFALSFNRINFNLYVCLHVLYKYHIISAIKYIHTPILYVHTQREIHS